jgi:hypothetical protein
VYAYFMSDLDDNLVIRDLLNLPIPVISEDIPGSVEIRYSREYIFEFTPQRFASEEAI